MSRQSIKEEWESYRDQVIPPDAGATQREECMRAFYAGARSLNRLHMDYIATLPMHEAEVAMVRIDKELKDFVRRVKAMPEEKA